MNFYAMKRNKLKLLCKKHQIPANITNIEMAKRLTLLHKVQIQKMKKVSFNPETQIFYFEATPKYTYSSSKKKRVQKRKSRVKQAPKKKQVQLADIGRGLEFSVNIIATPLRLTRSSAQRLQQGNAEAKSLSFSVRKNVRSVVKNAGGNKTPPEIKLSEGVAGDEDSSISGGILNYKKLRSRMVVCTYGRGSMVSRK